MCQNRTCRSKDYMNTVQKVWEKRKKRANKFAE
jgi:hypothetical protein